MPHARLTHPSRPTLEFEQAQRDADSRQAVANVQALVADEQPPLVHVESRERDRSITGRVTAPRRAEGDTSTSDWAQALANYVDRLEAHVTEFQGEGYTLEDDIRDESINCVYHGLTWTLTQGQPFEVEYELNLTVGRGAFGSRSIDRRNPTVDTSMSVAAKVGGEDLPGLRQMEVSREFGIEVTPLYNKASAEVNDVLAESGPEQRIAFEGTHTGTHTQRAAADAALESLLGTAQVTFETRFPGYDLDGYLVGYDSNLEQRFGESSHHYSLTFIEGERA